MPRLRPFGLLANARRAREIAAVAARHGFADLVQHLGARRRWWTPMLPDVGPRRRAPERLRLALQELGPTFVKVGQMLASRPDLIPPEYVAELRLLQDKVTPLPFVAMRGVLLDELGHDPAQLFVEFSETPLASASLAQVYTARLRDGRPVAVKVQRPGLRAVIEVDLELLTWFAAQAHQRNASLQPYDLPAVVAEARDGLLRELDYRHEAANQEFFNATNRFPEQVYAPAVVRELTTARVLVMERIDGHRFEVAAAALLPAQRKQLAHTGARSLLHQVLVAGFFHADPHPGNLLLTPDGRICFLDWGLAGHLTPRLRYTLADLFTAAAAGDAEQLVQIALNLATAGSRPDTRQMEKEVILALRENFSPAVGRQEIGRTIFRLLEIFGRNGASLSRDYVLMAKAVSTIELTGRSLDPEFNLAAIARPILVEMQRQRWGRGSLWRRTRVFLGSSLNRLHELPDRLERIFRRLESDDLTINFQHRGLEDLDDALNAASSRLTMGIIVAALLIGSSLIMTTRIPPLLFGYPVFGVVGYLMAAMVAVWIVWDIIRHGHHR